MNDIKISTEFIRSLAGKMQSCSDHIRLAATMASDATASIESGVINSSIINVNAKMASIRKRIKSMQTSTEANVQLLNLIADTFEDIDKNMKNLIPDWAKETFTNSNYYRAEDNQVGSVSYRNDDGAVSCTYYTLHRLREKGLGFPFRITGRANGGYWFDNCSESAKKYPGNDCLTDIFNDYCTRGKEAKNIVVSMPSKSPAGHVILIDRMFKKPETGEIMIEWSDMCYPFSKIYGDVNTINPSKTVTLAKFRDYYKGWTGDFKGAVLIGE